MYWIAERHRYAYDGGLECPMAEVGFPTDKCNLNKLDYYEGRQFSWPM